jgi:hypothetical protein
MTSQCLAWAATRCRGMRKATVSCTIGFGLLFLGCRPNAEVALRPAPPQWPQTWAHRQLYCTPHAYVYASSQAAAGEADRLAAAVGQEFELQTGGKPDMPLLIVTDSGDGPLFANPQDWLPLARAECDDETVEFTANELDQVATHALAIAPVRVTQAQLTRRLEFPDFAAQAAGEAVVLPTYAALRKGLAAMIRAALDDAVVDPLTRVALAPILSLAESAAVDELAAARAVVVFEHFAAMQRDWTEQERLARVQAYEQRKTGGVTGNTGKLVRTSSGELRRDP